MGEQCSSPAAFFATASHHPLFSIAATSILIAFLYVPRPLLTLVFSPALIATILLLAALHRFGSSAPPPQATQQTSTPPSSSPIQQQQQQQQQQQKPPVEFRSELVESWERPAGWPLDVIYEEYEGVDGDSSEYSAAGLRPFGACFTDSDSESDDDAYLLQALEGRDSLEFLSFRWEEEGDGMIEIELEKEEEEENLIEIDISGCRR